MFFVHYIAKSILSRSQTWFKVVSGAPYGDKIDNDCEARKQSESWGRWCETGLLLLSLGKLVGKAYSCLDLFPGSLASRSTPPTVAHKRE
jgi:hypothetical protein